MIATTLLSECKSIPLYAVTVQLKLTWRARASSIPVKCTGTAIPCGASGILGAERTCSARPPTAGWWQEEILALQRVLIWINAHGPKMSLRFSLPTHAYELKGTDDAYPDHRSCHRYHGNDRRITGSFANRRRSAAAPSDNVLPRTHRLSASQRSAWPKRAAIRSATCQ